MKKEVWLGLVTVLGIRCELFLDIVLADLFLADLFLPILFCKHTLGYLVVYLKVP